MATTSNYGWTIPDDTDLVKNGALAIRTLGNAIDTTAAASFGGGLVHIQTTNFSGAVSHSFGSDASPIFTSDYRNYRIILDNLQAATSDQNVNFRLRANTTDLTSSVYDYQQLTASNTAVTGSRAASGTSTRIGVAGGDAGFTGVVVLDILNPQTGVYKHILSQNTFFETGVGIRLGNYYSSVRSTAAHNGFTFFASTNLSGTMSVYGYKI